MTSLIAWVGIDSRRVSSLYIATDSRLTWAPLPGKWDQAKKTFACSRSPDAFGYVGDACFFSVVVGQLVVAIDHGIIFGLGGGHEEKRAAVQASLAKASESYPLPFEDQTGVVHISRCGEGGSASYSVNSYYVRGPGRVVASTTPIPAESAVVAAEGSGRLVVSTWQKYWQNSDVKKTSRAVFSAFCDAIRSEGDPRSGGAPQLVGLYPNWPPRTYGIVFGGLRFFQGVRVDDASLKEGDALAELEWRNELFERCDGLTMKPLPEAQRHARPADLRQP